MSNTSDVLVLNEIAGISGHAENLSAHDTGTVCSSRLPIPLFGTRFAYKPITTRYSHGKPETKLMTSENSGKPNVLRKAPIRETSVRRREMIDQMKPNFI